MRHHQQYPRKSQANKNNSNDHENLGGGDEDQFSPNLSYRMMNMDSVVDYLSDDESDSEMPNGSKLEISNPVRDVITRMLHSYISDEKNNTELEFPSSLFCHERKFVRHQAQQRNLLSRTIVRGTSRLIIVFKSSNEIVSANSTNQSPKQFNFSLKNPKLIEDINTYLQNFPLSAEENSLLQAKIQKTPASLNDWFYCTLLRSGNPVYKLSDNKPRIPEEKYLSHDFYLPIDQATATKDHLLHLIENNKILFVNGPPAVGKSLRISQYLNDEYCDKQWPIRILHSCSNNLSAHALASLFPHPIDCFTFENMSLTSEWTSLITLTTHEFLLHTLISGDSLLKSSLTHLIIDDVHKRSHTLDMLLAYLKDTQTKFRHLKIIFLQTNIQYDTLVKYFGNVSTYTIEIKSEEIGEKFLDDVLVDLEHIDANQCLTISNYGLDLLNHWCHLAEQSSKSHRISDSIYPDSFQTFAHSFEANLNPIEKHLNQLISRCFIHGLIEDLQILLKYLLDNPQHCNYQHSLTLLTPLMCFAMWSMKSSLEELFTFDHLLFNLRAVNNYSAIDFARKYATNETIDFLESSIVLDSLLFEQILCLKNASPIMKLYLQTRKTNDIIDYELIGKLIQKLMRKQRQNHILVFLPGIDAIAKMKQNLHESDIEICMLLDSSSWDSINISHPRLVILCDGNCETGVPFHTINCVIDTGITFEKCSHSSTTKFLPKYNWINQISANERKSRTKTGLCYRIYPRDLFEEKITENIHSEMARQPLLENLMQAKLFAWTSCSVAEFMLKLPYPPPFAIVRAGITQLKNLDLVDKWEDLVDLGAYCLALPMVELPYALMIIYAHFFKCLEPILILISTLTIGDPFQTTRKHETLLKIKKQFSYNQSSDHYVFYQLYQQWKQANNKKEFCRTFLIEEFRMEQIDSFKKYLTNFLTNINFSNFFYSNSTTKIDYNQNSTCWPLIQAILIRCLPQNLLTYDQHWLTTRNELVIFDSNSILTRFEDSKENQLHFAICDHLVRSNKGLFTSKHSSLIDEIVFVLFGLNPDYPLVLTENNNLLKLRTKFLACLKRKFQSLGCEQMTKNEYDLINLFVQILSHVDL